MPWGTNVSIGGDKENVFWTADNITDDDSVLFRNATEIDRDHNKAYFKDDADTSSLYSWWLRSPNSYFGNAVLYVDSSGGVNSLFVDYPLGVRPALKLNPQSVIFTSEIKTGGDKTKGETEEVSGVYSGATATDAKNFKLTVLGDDGTGTNPYELSALKDINNNAITDGDVIATSGEIKLKGTANKAFINNDATNDYSINYKIVEGTTDRKIVGYGIARAQATADANNEIVIKAKDLAGVNLVDNEIVIKAKDLAGVNLVDNEIVIKAKDLAGVNLVDGDYTVYVWLQKTMESTRMKVRSRCISL